MTNLSPSAQALVRAGARAARPSAADRARLSEALRDRLGDAAVLGSEAGVAVSGSAASAVWLKVCAVTAGLGLLVGGGLVALRPAQPPVAVMPAQKVAASEPVEPAAPQRQAEPATAAAPPQVAPVEPAAAAPRRPADRLAQEVALLSRATSALRSGRPGDALKALSEHQSQFPKGALSEERRAARAQALCALGRRSEAQADLATLARTAPQSPQAARARQVCGGTR